MLRWLGRFIAFTGPLGLIAHAVIFMGTGDPSHNTSPPTGVLADSGWQFQGRWNGLFATAIAPDFFITAGHVGGESGQAFEFQGHPYMAVASYLAPEADLRLWRVVGTLPAYAPRYQGFSEPGHGVVVFGCGTQRGAPVVVQNETKGWLWGVGDGMHRWGTNTINQVVDAKGQTNSAPVPQPGDLLSCTFDAEAGGDEVTLSGGDSGGGMFLFDDGQWKLAGINLAVEATFKSTMDGAEFNAAIFDRGGLIEQADNLEWVANDDAAENLPAVLLAVRVSGNEGWISDVLAGRLVPERVVTVESSATITGPFVVESAAQLDAANARFLVPADGATRFYRLRANRALKLQSLTAHGDTFILNFAP